MKFIEIAIIGFIVLEITNVIALYFFPRSKYANSVGVFKAWEKSKSVIIGFDCRDLVRRPTASLPQMPAVAPVRTAS